jgi:exopolysaccharide biosynthesis predicted pyruvyltransferase EpsI
VSADVRGIPPAARGLDELRDRVRSTLGGLLGAAGECGLVDFPRHLNVGDQAIWLGERAALDALGVRVAAACDRTNYGSAFRRALGDAPVCIHGGGNFGDLYPTHHALREQVLRDLPDRRVIQLAQSINFGSAEGLERTRRLISEHGRVTLLVRDDESERFAREHFEADVVACPDMAFALPPLRRTAPPVAPVVRQARRDKESAGDSAPEGTFDWLEPPTGARARRTLALRRADLALSTGRRESARRAPRLLAASPTGAYDRFARWSVGRGLGLLCRGEVVITDRLHGHILCTLAAIPHVVLGDRHGKIRAFWDTWSAGLGTARWAQDAGEATRLADDLAGRDRVSGAARPWQAA